jgi:hypothetical protein
MKRTPTPHGLQLHFAKRAELQCLRGAGGDGKTESGK